MYKTKIITRDKYVEVIVGHDPVALLPKIIPKKSPSPSPSPLDLPPPYVAVAVVIPLPGIPVDVMSPVLSLKRNQQRPFIRLWLNYYGNQFQFTTPSPPLFTVLAIGKHVSMC